MQMGNCSDLKQVCLSFELAVIPEDMRFDLESSDRKTVCYRVEKSSDPVKDMLRAVGSSDRETVC